jgi:outer membrane protein assembly factor BamE (lipoprotein component of BamABCDE complex)
VIQLLAVCVLATTTPALAQRDSYGNKIAPDVAKYQRDQARQGELELAMRQRRIIPGMTEADVRNTLGVPSRINDNGGFVQWVYDFTYGLDGSRRPGSTYVYFRDGLTR